MFMVFGIINIFPSIMPKLLLTAGTNKLSVAITASANEAFCINLFVKNLLKSLRIEPEPNSSIPCGLTTVILVLIADSVKNPIIPAEAP